MNVGMVGETVAAAIARTARLIVEMMMRLSMSNHARGFSRGGGIRRGFRNSEQTGWGLFRKHVGPSGFAAAPPKGPSVHYASAFTVCLFEDERLLAPSRYCSRSSTPLATEPSGAWR